MGHSKYRSFTIGLALFVAAIASILLLSGCGSSSSSGGQSTSHPETAGISLGQPVSGHEVQVARAMVEVEPLVRACLAASETSGGSRTEGMDCAKRSTYERNGHPLPIGSGVGEVSISIGKTGVIGVGSVARAWTYSIDGHSISKTDDSGGIATAERIYRLE